MSRYGMLAILLSLLLLNGPVFSAGPQGGQGAEQIYGAELMNMQEQEQYRQRLQLLQGEQEKEQFRIQHQHEMRERAKALGISLPDQPRDGSYGHSFGSGASGSESKGPKR